MREVGQPKLLTDVKILNKNLKLKVATRNDASDYQCCGVHA